MCLENSETITLDLQRTTALSNGLTDVNCWRTLALAESVAPGLGPSNATREFFLMPRNSYTTITKHLSDPLVFGI